MFLNTLIEKAGKSIFSYEQALNYLHSRQVTDEEIKEFKIGFSRIVTLANDGSEDYKEFSDRSHKGRKLENRLIFPIFDMVGKPVGFITRSIEIKEYELYLTKEGKDFGAMFGLFQALPHIYKSDRVHVVEGPFDLLAFQKVFKNSVATNTAELTPSQHEQLGFYAKQIITVFDSDKPGRAATERARENYPGIRQIDLGYKDPSNCLMQSKSLEDFRKRVTSKIGI